MVAQRGRTENLPEIRVALAEQRFEDAERKATAIIEGPATISSAQRQAYMRSLAYLYRSEARRGLGADEGRVLSDVYDSAMLGNLMAIRQLVDTWTGSVIKGDPSAAKELAGVDMSAVLAAGVELDEGAALKAAASGYGSYSARERELFALRYELQTNASTFVDHVRRFAQSMDARELMRSHFLVGPDFPPLENLPGRDVLATFRAESYLRSTLASGLGLALPAQRPAEELSLREIMELNSWLGDMSGLTTIYHFTPEEPGISARHVVLDPQKLDAEIQPGDSVNVRCGGIAHTAVVLQIDRSLDVITFTDPLYEYWQPENNNCITSFALKPYKYGYQAAVLKLSEVNQILDSVQGMRSFVPPKIVGDPAPDDTSILKKTVAACRGSAFGRGILGMQRAEALKHDFFEFFNFERIGASASGVTTIETYMVRALEFRGDVLLRVQTQNRCIVSASLFLRRSFLEGSSRPFASDLLRSFLAAIFEGEDKKQLQAAIARPATPGVGGKEDLDAVFSGAKDAVSFHVAGRTTVFGNVETETGSRWLRVDSR
ncbi:hypothetical protein ACI2VH_16830 [Ralstonia nicotianae]